MLLIELGRFFGYGVGLLANEQVVKSMRHFIKVVELLPADAAVGLFLHALFCYEVKAMVISTEIRGLRNQR